jgi:Integrase core domain
VARHADTEISMPGNGYVESFNGKLRDELLDGEVFYSLREAEVVIESWRRHLYVVPSVKSCLGPLGSSVLC